MTALSTLPPALLVFIGGGAGALLRWLTGRGMTSMIGVEAVSAFPWATLFANVAGSLAMGVLAAWLARNSDGSAESWRLLLGVGLLGGFTTFSAFSLEMLMLIQRGDHGLAVSYAALSVAAGLAALWLGLAAMRGAAA